MKFACILAIVAVFGVQGVEVGVTPVQKVIQLLEGMLAKGKAEKHDEQVQFATYKQFCDDTSVEKTRAISEAEEEIEVLKADIQKYATDSATLTKEIAGHDEDISVWTGDSKAATNVRGIEKTDYDNLHKDYSESVDALERAIAVLKKQAYDRTQASFSQLSALQGINLIPKEAKAAIESFLAQDPQTGLEVSAPDAYGYEFQSHGVIDMLEKLLDKFITERSELEKSVLLTDNERLDSYNDTWYGEQERTNGQVSPSYALYQTTPSGSFAAILRPIFTPDGIYPMGVNLLIWLIFYIVSSSVY